MSTSPDIVRKRLDAAKGRAMLEFGQLLDLELGKLVAGQFSTARYEHTWNPTNKLGIGTGKLRDSYIRGADHILEVRREAARFVVTLGSRNAVASIHEGEGEVQIRSKGRMHKWAWAMYSSTKKEFYKIVALSIMKRGYVTVKKRSVFKPAVDELVSTRMQILAEQFVGRLIEAMR